MPLLPSYWGLIARHTCRSPINKIISKYNTAAIGLQYQLSSNTAHHYSHRLVCIPPTSWLSSLILYHLRPIAPIERTNQAVWCTIVIICMRVPKIMQLPLDSCTLRWTVWSRIWSVTRRSAYYSQIPLKCIDSQTLGSYLLIDSEEEWEYYHHLHVLHTTSTLIHLQSSLDVLHTTLIHLQSSPTPFVWIACLWTD